MRLAVLFFFCLGFLPGFASAVDYYWELTYQGGGLFREGATGSNPRSACQAGFRNYSDTEFVGVEVLSATSATCVATFNNGSATDKTATLTRRGDSCPVDKPVYNSDTGECEPEPKDCSETVGEALLARSSGPIAVVNGRSYVISSPPSVCSVGCSYDPASNKATTCYADSGSTTSGFCNYVVEGTGEPCTVDNLVPGGTGDPLPSGETPDPEAPPSDPNDPGCPSGYSWSGTTCVKSDGTGGSGDGSGGSGDGSGTGSGDGSGDGTGSGGSSGGGSSGGGSGDGSGTGSGDGSGDGTGSGGGGVGGDGDGEGEGLPSGTLEEPERGSFDEAITEWDQKIADSRAELKTKHAQLSQLVAAQTSFDLSDTSGRLFCESVDFYGRSVSICLDEYSDQLSVIRYVLIFLATLLAFYIIFVRD